jgi:Fe-S cluster assembly protein SufD
MMATHAPESNLVKSLRDIGAVLKSFGPPEWDDLRSRALGNFTNLGVPTSRDEEYRYLNLRALTATEFAPAYGVNLYREDVAKVALHSLQALTITFVNGQYAPELSSEQPLANAFVGTLQEGFQAHPEVIREHLGKLAGSQHGKLGSHLNMPFVELNTAFLGEGALVYVPMGISVEIPIHIQYLHSAEEACAVHPRTLIVLEENSQAKIIESYVGLAGNYFTNPVTEVVIGQSAILEHVRLQDETREAIHISATQTIQAAKSNYTSIAIDFGAKLARHDTNLWLDGEHTESRLDGIYVADGEQVVDNHTRIDHRMPNCASHEVFKGILSGKSTGIFNGKIFVYEDAQKTDAKQTNQALLLSPQATINTKPQLEIFADDVKCTHGATVGQMREEAVFYLRSRGIPKAQAEALLIYAFAAEVLERISMRPVADALEKALFTKLGQG